MKEKKKKGEITWVVLPLLFICAIISGLYIASMRYYTEGGLSLPLDDSFIFFQYAKQFAAGLAFQYNTGDTPTTGVTSLLYTLLLVPGFILGFDGLSIIKYSLFLSLLTLIGTGFFAYLIGKQLVSHIVGVISMLLVILSGPFIWATFSGMDTGLFGFMLVLTFWTVIAFYEKKNLFPIAIAGSLLSITRPEGFIASIILFSLIFVNQLIKPKNERLPFIQSILSAVPVLSGILWLLLNLILTGSISFNTIASKSQFATGHSSVLDCLATGIRYFFFLLKEVFAGFSGDYIGVLNANSGYPAVYIAPFSLLFFIFAIFPQATGEVIKRRLGAYSLGFLWFFVGIFVASLSKPDNIHWHRYIIPYYPLFLIMVAVGVHQLSQTLQKEGFLGISIFFVLFSFLTAIYFGIAFGKNCKDIHLQQITIARWIEKNIPEDAAIALNDAGAIKYLSQRYCIDLVGLCYPKIVRSGTHAGDGNGSLYETVEKLERKPDYFIIYPSWFAFPDYVLGEEKASFGLSEPTVAGAGSEPMKVYKANFRYMNTGDNIQLSFTKETIGKLLLSDRIDIADVEDEKRHNHKSWTAEPGLSKRTFVTLASYQEEPERIVADAGRVLTGGEEFTIKTIPNKDLIIVARTTAPFSLGLYINGQAREWWRNLKGSHETSLWHEPMVKIPGSYITSEKTKIRLEVVDKHQVSYFTTHYWFYQ
ncbi:MAG: hypothetical protein QME07_01340 [bacterium]|nr:hypothetical protein [bacterium]